MSLWVSVQGFVDEEYLVESVLNRPIHQLRKRTDYLYNRLETAVGSGSSLRLPDVSLATDTDFAPSVNDVVYLNPTTNLYEQAIASIDVAAGVLFETDTTSYGLGLLVAKSTDGSTGTVVIFGEHDLNGVDMSTLMESTDTFRSGALYLSNKERGKLSTYPSGPEIYVGYFANDSVILGPQYRSFAEAHIHQSFPLNNTPVGATEGDDVIGILTALADETYHGEHDQAPQAVLEDSGANWAVNNLVGLRVTNVTQSLTAVITANTATTITASMGSDWNTSDQYFIEERHGLVAFGDFTGDKPVTYTCKLADTAGTGAPSTFGDCYLHYTSSDPAESGSVRVPAYDFPITIGTKGLQVYLRRRSTSLSLTTVEQDPAEARRTYVFTVDADTEGWRDNEFRDAMTDNVATDTNNTLFIRGNYTNGTDDSATRVTVRAGSATTIEFTGVPTDGDVLVLVDHGLTFEFDDNSTVTGTNIAVAITAGDADACANELFQALLLQELSGLTAVLHDNNTLVLITDTTAVTDITGTSLPTTTIATNTASSPIAFSDADFYVYDQNNLSISDVDPAFELDPTSANWVETDLSNGLRLGLMPYDTDGTAAAVYEAEAGDYWEVELDNEGQNAEYRYNVGMNSGLSKFYPSVPLKSASLVLGGIEQPSYAHFPDAAVYQVACSGLFWHDTLITPWDASDQAVLHLVRPRAGDTGLVRMLQPAEGSPISIVECGTDKAATTGDLEIDLDLSLLERNDNLAGSQVYKSVSGNKLIKGPVVEQILPGPGYEVVSAAGVENGYGKVQLQLHSANTQGDFVETAFQNAKHEMIGLFPYVRLLGWTTGGSNVPSGFTAKFNLPPNLEGLYQFIVTFTLFGEDPITTGRELAGLKFNYSVLHDYEPEDATEANLQTGLITPPAEIDWEIPIGQTSATYTAYDPMLVHTSQDLPADDEARAFRASSGPYPKANDLKYGTPEPVLTDLALRAGSQVAIQIQRGDIVSGTEYNNALGLLNLRWRLIPVE